MINYIQPGEIMKYSNAGSAISAGDIVVIGERIGVAITDIAATSGEGSVQMEGVFSLPKATGTAWSQGDQLFYDAGAGKLTKVATGNKPAGYAFEAAASGDTTGLASIESPRAKQAAIVAFSAGTNLVGVDGAGSNAAPLAGTETRLDALDTAVLALIAAMKASGQMSNS